MLCIKFFASLRERLNTSEVSYDLKKSISVEGLIDCLIENDSRFVVLKDEQILIAINQTLSSVDSMINIDDEIAFFPPVTGG